MSRKAVLTAASLLLLTTAACGNDAGSQPPAEASPGEGEVLGTETTETDPGGDPTGDATAEPGADPSAAMVQAEDYSPDRFDDTAAFVDHRWFPLTPGTVAEYRGSSLEDDERLRHSVVSIVTDLVKVIDGVPSVVVWERDYTEGELVEAELAFFAQDSDGHVWHNGEYPEEYEEGKLVESPAWIHGLAGASAGITIPAEPTEGTPDYAQGFAPKPVNWVDRGRVHKTGQEVCVPAGCYDDVVVIEEFEPTIEQAFQDKFYAPGVGVVKVGWRGKNDENKEVLELVEFRELTDAQLAKAREAALQLEEKAYGTSKDVYAKTERSEATAR